MSVEYIDNEEYIMSPLEEALLTLLKKEGPQLRREMVQKIEKPRTTIFDNLTRLIQHNLVRKYSRPINKRGRPLVYFRASEGD